MSLLVRSLAALFFSAALLIAGNGLQASLLSVRGEIEQFPLELIGAFMSAYYIGFIAGCRVTPVLVRRAGHIRVFAAFASIASATALAHVLAVDALFWIGLRIISGFALAGVYMIIESWLNEAADNHSRGRILAVYRVIDLTALTAGQALLAVADPASFTLFACASIILSLALVPISLATTATPKPIDVVELNFSKLFSHSPAAAAACFGAGLGNSAFWAVGPVYAQKVGFDISLVASFMSVTVIGGAITQWPLGVASDRMDRRVLILLTSLAAALISFSMARFGAVSIIALLSGGLLYGAFALPLYGLAIAHANDRADPDEYISLNATLLFLFGIGAVIGPILGPLTMQILTASSLFIYIGTVYSLLFIFILIRVFMRGPVADKEKEDFAPLPRSTPAVLELDPRTPETVE